MSGRKYCRVIVVLLLAVIFRAGLLYAQYGNLLSWESVDGAGGYILEIRDSQKKVIVEKELDVTHYDISKLTPGHYQYRLTTLNKLLRKGNNTGWINFHIEKAVIPVVKSVSSKVLYRSYDNPPLTVTGENFLTDTRLYLKKDSETVELNTRYISGGEIQALFSSEKKITGVYNLVAVNRGGFEYVMKSAIEIKEPFIPVVENSADNKAAGTLTYDKAKKNKTGGKGAGENNTSSCVFPDLTNLVFGAGWDIAIPAGSWSSKLDFSLTGFHLYFSYPLSEFNLLKNIPVIKGCGVEALFNYAGYRFKDGTSTESLSKAGGYAGINYLFIPGYFPGGMSLILNLDAGTAYSSMSILEYKKPEDYTSLDFAIRSGLTIRYEWFRHFFTDISAGYGRTFYVAHPLDEVTLSLRAGIRL